MCVCVCVCVYFALLWACLRCKESIAKLKHSAFSAHHHYDQSEFCYMLSLNALICPCLTDLPTPKHAADHLFKLLLDPDCSISSSQQWLGWVKTQFFHNYNHVAWFLDHLVVDFKAGLLNNYWLIWLTMLKCRNLNFVLIKESVTKIVGSWVLQSITKRMEYMYNIRGIRICCTTIKTIHDSCKNLMTLPFTQYIALNLAQHRFRNSYHLV